ncbi:MAG: type II toxin-antitoxin system VapC family toxin [Methylocystis sp.]|nr:type II toxin-antitoxin system VapC family toxin [Methylocystis sp.]MCA3582915.1 type II toxin-antitoxin system VapC family toxin [Methylocystis sp.]MCA3589514.1 type II toxin-antitoxin system VapC family toxin [Methylocystis sp.]MCA3590320.1 type II toxin-antitoxin system VapC family toxin [Methylocystis sp.]
MPYLLDTNILSQVVRNPAGDVAARLRLTGEDEVFTSVVVAAELRFGVEKSGSAHLARNVEDVLDSLRIAPLDIPADTRYGLLRANLERSGTPISANDMFIAAHALATDSILVTDNVREFSRVPGLKIENWLYSMSTE